MVATLRYVAKKILRMLVTQDKNCSNALDGPRGESTCRYAVHRRLNAAGKYPQNPRFRH